MNDIEKAALKIFNGKFLLDATNDQKLMAKRHLFMGGHHVCLVFEIHDVHDIWNIDTVFGFMHTKDQFTNSRALVNKTFELFDMYTRELFNWETKLLPWGFERNGYCFIGNETTICFGVKEMLPTSTGVLPTCLRIRDDLEGIVRTFSASNIEPLIKSYTQNSCERFMRLPQQARDRLMLSM